MPGSVVSRVLPGCTGITMPGRSPHSAYSIGSEREIGRHDSDITELCLRDQQSVKWVFVMEREFARANGIIELDGEIVRR